MKEGIIEKDESEKEEEAEKEEEEKEANGGAHEAVESATRRKLKDERRGSRKTAPAEEE